MDVANLPAAAAFGVAIAAGATSFLSPCVAPLLPGYVAFVAPEGARFTRALGFVAGFTLLFAALGATAASVSRTLVEHRPLLELISGLAVAMLGIAMVFDKSFIPARLTSGVSARAASSSGPANALAAMPVGAAFAIAWAPCIGPALAAILALAAGDARPGYGALLLVAYGLGLGIPFLLGALALDRVTRSSRALRAHTRTIRITAGALLAVLGIAIATGTFGQIAGRLAQFVPGWLA